MSRFDFRDFYDRYITALNTRDFNVMDKFIHDEVTLNGNVARTWSAIVTSREVPAS